MRVQTIPSIRKRFRNEWLLIRVSKFDEATTTSLKGRLLAHSPDRDKIYKKSLKVKGLVYVAHSSNKLPKGYAVAF